MASREVAYKDGFMTTWYDFEDGAILDLYNLFVMKTEKHQHYYLQGVLMTDKTNTRVQMSRVIMNTPPGQHCHHIGDTMDNRRANLSNEYPKDHAPLCNQAKKKGNYIGVRWDANCKKWHIQLQHNVNGKMEHLYQGRQGGTELEAAIKYDREAIRFGRPPESINFPEDAHLRTAEIARGM